MRRAAWLVLFSLLLVPATAHAQSNVATGNKLGWTQTAQAPAIANSFTYNLYVDALTGQAVTGVTCVANAANSDCTGNVPAMTLGLHTLTLTQASGSAESSKSSPLSVTFVVLVTPSGLKIVGVFDHLAFRGVALG
jgi:hypothetical protein